MFLVCEFVDQHCGCIHRLQSELFERTVIVRQVPCTRPFAVWELDQHRNVGAPVTLKFFAFSSEDSIGPPEGLDCGDNPASVFSSLIRVTNLVTVEENIASIFVLPRLYAVIDCRPCRR